MFFFRFSFVFFSKTHQSSLTLKGGSTSHLGLLPSGKKRKPPYSVLKPLRYKVGGPSEVFASSGAAFCGMRPHGYESLTGCRKAMKPIAARPEPTVRSPAEGKGKGRAISVSFLVFGACCLYGLLITQYALL